MADLLTHLAVAHLLKRASPYPDHAGLFALGTVLPDVLGRAPNMALFLLEHHLNWEAPAPASIGVDVLHTPLTFAIFCLFSAYLCPQNIRRLVFWNLCLGGAVHMLVDLTQRHMDVGYCLLFPFSFVEFELAWIGTEDSLYAAPFLVLLALILEVRFWRTRPRPLTPPPQPPPDGSAP